MPYLLQARSGPDNLWIMPDHQGMPPFGPFLDANGEEIRDLIANGQVDRIDFLPRFTRRNSGKIGDLIWTTGDHAKVASRRFVDVLDAIEATGYRTFPVEALGRNGRSIGDFVGLAILDDDTSKDLYSSNGFQFWSFIASDRVVEALREGGVTGLSIKRA
jgi:hypothetical protein